MNYKLDGDIMGFDLGKARTGVARLNTIARIAEPLKPITMSESFIDTARLVVKGSGACAVVVGVPRGLDGQTTDQTKWAYEIIKQLSDELKVPVFSIDEAVTTKKAEERALPGQSVDSVAAGIILEDFTNEVLRGRIENVSF